MFIFFFHCGLSKQMYYEKVCTMHGCTLYLSLMVCKLFMQRARLSQMWFSRKKNNESVVWCCECLFSPSLVFCMDSSRDTQEPEKSCSHILMTTFRLMGGAKILAKWAEVIVWRPRLIQRADPAAWPELQVMSTTFKNPAEDLHHAHAHGCRRHRCAFLKSMLLAYGAFITENQVSKEADKVWQAKWFTFFWKGSLLTAWSGALPEPGLKRRCCC